MLHPHPYATRVLFLGFCSLLLWGILPGAGELCAQVAVIAHTSVSHDELSQEQLLDVYTGDTRTWGNGERVVVFDLKVKGAIRDTFYNFLGRKPSRMKSIWLKRMLSGEGDPPEAIPSEDSLLQRVASSPGSIGYISQAKANSAVKILSVIQSPNQDSQSETP
jgi:ABC-type phosphate transport system substrate-binding protein